MTDAVFDTTVLIDAYYRREGAVALLGAATSGRIEVGYSPITVYELWLGLTNRSEETFLTSMLLGLQELPLNSTVARLVARWLGGYSRSQRLTLAADAMIAATAASLGATICTRNPRDFTRFYTDVQSY
jgi:predicted nucleic acid-binding protein